MILSIALLWRKWFKSWSKPTSYLSKIRIRVCKLSRCPNSINNNLDNMLFNNISLRIRLIRHYSLTRSQWNMRSYYPPCLWKILSRLDHLRQYLRNCRLVGDLISVASSIKGHKVMTLSTASLWRLKSKSWSTPMSCLSKIWIRACSRNLVAVDVLSTTHLLI